MNPSQQQQAIAKACGWRKTKRGFGDGAGWVHDNPEQLHMVFGTGKELPNYTGDLKAMHEAEKVLTIDQEYNYGLRLARMTIGKEFDEDEFSPNGWGYFSVARATPQQRAEAFLRTLGLWEE